MWFLIEHLNNFFKKIKFKRKIAKAAKNPRIPFYLIMFGKSLPQIEVVRQFQLSEMEIPLTDKYGFAIYLIVYYNPRHEKNIKKLSFFKEMINVDEGKYLYLYKNDFDEMNKLLSLFMRDIFETELEEEYSMHIDLLLPSSSL